MKNSIAVHPRRRSGLSLAELLISIAMAAVLLTAAAAAFEASSDAITANEQLFRVSRTARVAMNHMVTESRRGQATEVVDASTLDVITADDAYYRYKYYPDSKELRVITPDIPDDPDYVLAREVGDLTFACDEETDEVTGLTRVVRVTIDMTVNAGKISMHLSGAVSPRRNRSY